MNYFSARCRPSAISPSKTKLFGWINVIIIDFTRRSREVASLLHWPNSFWLLSSLIYPMQAFQESMHYLGSAKVSLDIDNSKYAHKYAFEWMTNHAKPHFCCNTWKEKTKIKTNCNKVNIRRFEAVCKTQLFKLHFILSLWFFKIFLVHLGLSVASHWRFFLPFLCFITCWFFPQALDLS